jgi:hypothetical protein
MIPKRRTKKDKRRPKRKPKSRTVSSSRGGRSRKRLDLQEKTLQVFAEQADSLWSRLTDQCRQFAYGFNRVMGESALQVEAEPTTLRVAYVPGDAELFFQLDKEERYVQAWMNTGCATLGHCLSDQLPVGLMVRNNQLQFAFGGDIASDERIAVALLTQLTSGNARQEPSSDAP